MGCHAFDQASGSGSETGARFPLILAFHGVRLTIDTVLFVWEGGTDGDSEGKPSRMGTQALAEVLS
jgi:hypothetical protein